MSDWILLAVVNRLWYTLPLIASVSLVYAATRHEHLTPILRHAMRTALSIIVFMLIVLAILYLISHNL